MLGLQAAVGHRQLASAEGDPASTVCVAFGQEAREAQLIWTVWVVHGPATLEEFSFQVWRRILDEDWRLRSELFMIQGFNSIRRNLAFHMSRVSKQLPEGLLGKITLADKKNECQTCVSGRDPIQLYNGQSSPKFGQSLIKSNPASSALGALFASSR